MDIKGFFQKNWMYFAIIGIMVIMVFAFFKPQFEGYAVKQHDVKEWRAMSNEVDLYREESGKEPMWSSSAFGGMPAEQISMRYPGNWTKAVLDQYYKLIPPPAALILLHVLSFLVFTRLLRLNPWVGMIGAIAYSFASYELIVIQAGHLTKSAAAAFLPAILGAFIYAFKTNRLWGIVLLGIFMSLELAVNHVQVTYYFLFVLLFVGIYFLIEAFQEKTLKKFLITSAGVIGVLVLSVVINIGNILLTNDYGKYSIRGGNDVTITPSGETSTNQSAGLDRDYITQWSYGVDETFTFISPYVKGGASERLADSPFAEKIQNSDRSSDQINNALNGYSYWGNQPITSGPVYLGVIVALLAFLSLFFMKNKIKWAFFAVTILAIMLSWGKNFMGLTNFFIDHVPAYNKFRAVTMILILVELAVPVMGVLFLNELIKNREEIVARKKKFLIVLGSFVLFLFVLKVVGLGDGYSNPNEMKQYDGLSEMYTNQIMQMDPQVAMANYQLDLSNPQQVQEFVKMQVDSQKAGLNDVKAARKDIFHSSMNRSIIFAILAGGLFLVFLYSGSDKMAKTVLISGLIVLVFADMVPVAYNYLGAADNAAGTAYKFWEEKGNWLYPIAATPGDLQILQSEVTENPSLAAKIEKGKMAGEKVANELELGGSAHENAINSYRFYALGRATNYRVLDFSGGFSSSRPVYFHKSLSGYHGAKLRSIDNLINFQLSKTNNKVLDMLNVKYFIQPLQNGSDTAILNRTALGNAWLVKGVRELPTANDEIRALGNKFKLENKGTGVLLVNKRAVKEADVYGSESLQYLIPGRPDTVPVQLAGGLTKGQEAMFVVDSRGTTNLVPLITMQVDTTKSFTPLVYLKVESSFDPANEAVMLSSFASKLGKKTFSGEGSIKLLNSSPNKLSYSATVKGDQLAVFSEIYYPLGWKAFIDNKEVPILKVDYLLRGLELKDGTHKVEFRYDLPGYYKANMISRIGNVLLLLLIGLALYIRFRNKKKAGTTSSSELG